VTGVMLQLDLSEVVAVAKAMEIAPELVNEHFLPPMLQASFLAQREIVERTPRGIGAGGGLAGSIQAREPEIGVEQIVGLVGTPLAYAEPVEVGSRPHMPPLQPLVDWVRLKLKKKPQEVEGIARAIQWKIFHHGTKGHFMFRDGMKAVDAQVRQMLNQAARDLIADLAALGRSS